MSKESSQWLNQNTLIGFTNKRGHAWHYRASDQGSEPNHYPDAIPIEAVQRRLFAWQAQPRPLYVEVPDCGLVEVEGKQAITCSDTGHVLGIFSSGYTVHQYREWLLDRVSTILDNGLSIGSAGLLRDRAQAWVSVEVPDNITTPEGVVFRPNLLACTSHDGSLATTYKRVVTNVVCDKCAVRRFAASPAQPGRTRREVLGPAGLPGGESRWGPQHGAPRSALSYPRHSREEFGGIFLGLMPYPESKDIWGQQPGSKSVAVSRRIERRAEGSA